jgi:hypothetical protein
MSRPPGTMKDSNIGRLPPELRNSISELVLQAHFEGECCDHTGRTGTRFAVVEHIRGTTHHNRCAMRRYCCCSVRRASGLRTVKLAPRKKKIPMAAQRAQELQGWSAMMRKISAQIELTQDNLRIPTRLRATRGSNLGNQTTRTWVGVQNWDRYAHHSGGIKQARRGY